ncbi:MAG: DNA methyltransferase [Bacteroidota bacterium]|uniref:class I SAM-dependent DNA methyltransferase n=1 Tax=Runella sp. TaxID=1960881 RepID=UPI0030196FA2
MPLSWNEIKSRALAFSKEWENESSEHAESKPFWEKFFKVFAIERKSIARYEASVKKLGNKQGYIDLFWPGNLIIEHKSKGKDLDKAFHQAIDYFSGLKEYEIPKFILVSDFQRFRLYDLEASTQHDFPLNELAANVHLFGFIAGYQKRVYKDEDPVNIEAAERMGRLHDRLEEAGYTGHALEVYLVRMLFCLFSEDTGIFERTQFQDLIDTHTKEDGSDLALQLAQLFQVLNTPPDKRLKVLDETLAAFPYVNGKLFEENLPLAAFDSKMREMLLNCCALDWSQISPAIFGSMFQAVMNPKERRNLGAHYTSEKNIQKVIKPLFLDELYTEFEKAKGNRNRLNELHRKIAALHFLDPACGCGNFLIISYRELRNLELLILRELNKTGQMFLDVKEIIRVDVDQFAGIEYDEFPARVAEVAMWLMDHQMNMKVSDEFGQYFVRLPLNKAAKIVHGNALRVDWAEVVPKEQLSYILGNPPFIGAKMMNETQRADIIAITPNLDGVGLLDYVSAWYLKAAQFIRDTLIQVAFVSTNSITQGEQVGVLWGNMLSKGVKINFAHRTFKWNNEARGVAAVHCVIVGFASFDAKQKLIFDYQDAKGEPSQISAQNINPYLVDAATVVLVRRSKPLGNVPEIGIGNKPIDGGHYLFTTEGKVNFLEKEPQSARYFRRWIGSDEFINGWERWCLWLGECPPDVLRKMPEAMKRVQAVREFRLASKSAPTQKLAETPTRFHVENMPDTNFLIIPEVSSERRAYIPIGFVSPETLASNLVKIIPKASLYLFGVLTSLMHMSWVRSVCGRLESRYRYSKDIVYNNFPFPINPTDAQKQKVEAAAQAVLDTRAKYPNSSLADLYDPLTMPPDLIKAHQALDKAVDLCYRSQAFTSELNRIEFLFGLYEQYTAPMFKDEVKKNKPLKKAKD